MKEIHTLVMPKLFQHISGLLPVAGDLIHLGVPADLQTEDRQRKRVRDSIVRREETVQGGKNRT